MPPFGLRFAPLLHSSEYIHNNFRRLEAKLKISIFFFLFLVVNAKNFSLMFPFAVNQNRSNLSNTCLLSYDGYIRFALRGILRYFLILVFLFFSFLILIKIFISGGIYSFMLICPRVPLNIYIPSFPCAM